MAVVSVVFDRRRCLRTNTIAKSDKSKTAKTASTIKVKTTMPTDSACGVSAIARVERDEKEDGNVDDAEVTLLVACGVDNEVEIVVAG